MGVWQDWDLLRLGPNPGGIPFEFVAAEMALSWARTFSESDLLNPRD